MGRLDVTGVIFDRHSYISQDKCDQPLTTESYVWPNKILIWTSRDPQLPSPPTGRPDLSQQLLVENLSSVSRNTALTLRKEVRFEKNGEIMNIDRTESVGCRLRSYVLFTASDFQPIVQGIRMQWIPRESAGHYHG